VSRRKDRGLSTTDIQNGVNQDVNLVLLRNLTGTDEFILRSPSRTNGAFLIEFPEIPLFTEE
jgi:hypothetical protein